MAFDRSLARICERDLQSRMAAWRRLAQEQLEGRSGSFEEGRCRLGDREQQMSVGTLDIEESVQADVIELGAYRKSKHTERAQDAQMLRMLADRPLQ